MRVNSNCIVKFATFSLVVALCCNISYANPRAKSNKQTTAKTSSGDSDVHLTSQLNIHYAQYTKSKQYKNQYEQTQPNSTTSKTSTTSITSGASSLTLPIKSSLGAVSAASEKPSLQSTYIYKAELPTHSEPEGNKIVNAVKLTGETSSALAQTSFSSNATNSSTINFEKDEELAKKIIGSSVVTSVSVILNGDEPEFTNAVGQKVPKPQLSLQVASPIDLLSPDRYEFYTFDEQGELVKRLMTLEEIQSIAANGDGEGPTIIHHGVIEDRDPEKNVQDIVNSVQSVLNKEVESNKNASTEFLPAFDTPDVSSSWSMILPAIFGNSGDVDIFANQKPQQIIMTPDTEIIETSTIQSVHATTKKSKPSKRKPAQKRKPITTTTDVPPQVIQEELDSQESVYTGMQQYQNLAASMQNYDGFSQLHMQPLYHKLPEIETSTRRVYINNQEVLNKLTAINVNSDLFINENLAKKPASVQRKPLPPHRVKKPSESHTTTKRPQTNKQKLKRKPATSTTASIPFTTTTLASTTISTTDATTKTTTPTLVITVLTNTIVNASTIPASTSGIMSTTAASTTTAPQKKQKKPIHHSVLPTSTTSSISSQKTHLTVEKRKSSPKPHRTRPKPTKHQYIVSASDLAAEETAHQEVSHNKFQLISYNKKLPKPNKHIHSTVTSTIAPMDTILTTTVIFSPTPTTVTSNPIDLPLNVQDFSGFQQTVKYHEEDILKTRTTTNKPDSPTSVDIPSISGTSGYPVPSYDVSEKSSTNQLKKQALASRPLIGHGSIPYEQDAHTMVSFDQIMHSLKQPERISEKVSEKIESENITKKPAVYHNKNIVQFKSTSTLKPCYDHSWDSHFDTECIDFLGTNDASDIPNVIAARPLRNMTANIPGYIDTNKPTDKESNKTAEGTDIPNVISFASTIEASTIPIEPLETTHTSDKQVERNTEYQTPIHNSEIPDYTSISSNFQDSTIKNYYGNQVAEDYTEPLSVEYRPVFLPYREETSSGYESSSNHPILIANLKSQLNMAFINPSELITMSDFQTHAATVASTLIDGANTSPSDHSLMSSNDSRDEIALLLSDVIHQIPKINDVPPTTQINDNRLSNQGLLNLSFLMNNTKLHTHKIHSAVNNLEDNIKYQQNVKPIYERLENMHIKDHQNENLLEESTQYFSTSENLETTAIIETQDHTFSSETEKPTADASEEQLGYTMTTASSGSSMVVQDSPTFSIQQKKYNDNVYEAIGNQTKGSYEYKTDIFIENISKNDNSTPTLESTESDTVTQNIGEANEKFTTLKVPSLLKDERASLLESKSSLDTTTFISDLSEETVEENQSSIEDQENVVDESVIKNSKNQFQTDVPNQITTEFSTEGIANVTENDKKISLVNIEMTEGTEKTTLINKDMVTTKQGESYITEEQDDTNGVELTTLEGNKYVEESTEYGSEETTKTIYQTSEERADELNSMISEKDIESLDEDPYIKLGETTTLKPGIDTQTVSDNISSENKSKFEHDVTMLPPAKPIVALVENTYPEKTQHNIENIGQPYDESDAEDEDDQEGYNIPSVPNSVFSATTTPPHLSTTRRLSTLKPVSYFNKKPAYGIYQDSPEPIYNKESLYTQQKEIIPNKPIIYSTSTPQQRPMQRPPQLSNLLISSTQATRPPVNLDPSPTNSKGLEASLVNSDEDILAFAKLCNELAFNYWQSITSEKISSARSLVISPFALTSMLSMVFLGARGSTSGEMNDVLKLDDMVTFNPHLVFKNITDSIEKSTDADIATTAFVREIYSDRGNGKVLQFFKEKTQQLYAGHVEEVNFHVVNDIIRRRTNLLVKRHTMGKVLEYLRTNSVWVNGPLATISANLFQTDCSLGSTQDRDGEIFFQVHPTVRQRRLVPIPGVLFKSGFTAGYEINLDATVVAFGHLLDTTSVIYVMPGHLSSVSPSDNLDRLEKQLMETAISKNTWSNLLTSLMERPGIEVQIPRFSHRSFINATLGLQKMGLKGLFKSDYADLGGLTGSSNRDIYLSDMIQINTFSTCGEEKIADHHHIEMYPAPPLRKRNKNVDARDDDGQDSSEDVIDFGSMVQDSVLGRGFYDDLLDPKYLELPLPLRPRQARVPDTPRLRFDKPFLYFVRHNPTGMILYMGRFNPRLLP